MLVGADLESHRGGELADGELPGEQGRAVLANLEPVGQIWAGSADEVSNAAAVAIEGESEPGQRLLERHAGTARSAPVTMRVAVPLPGELLGGRGRARVLPLRLRLGSGLAPLAVLRVALSLALPGAVPVHILMALAVLLLVAGALGRDPALLGDGVAGVTARRLDIIAGPGRHAAILLATAPLVSLILTAAALAPALRGVGGVGGGRLVHGRRDGRRDRRLGRRAGRRVALRRRAGEHLDRGAHHLAHQRGPRRDHRRAGQAPAPNQGQRGEGPQEQDRQQGRDQGLEPRGGPGRLGGSVGRAGTGGRRHAGLRQGPAGADPLHPERFRLPERQPPRGRGRSFGPAEVSVRVSHRSRRLIASRDSTFSWLLGPTPRRHERDERSRRPHREAASVVRPRRWGPTGPGPAPRAPYQPGSASPRPRWSALSLPWPPCAPGSAPWPPGRRQARPGNPVHR